MSIALTNSVSYNENFNKCTILQRVLIWDSGKIWHFLIASIASTRSIIENGPWVGTENIVFKSTFI